MAIKDYSTTAGNNTSISGINIAEGCPPSNINNAIRAEMADVRSFYEAATWTDLGHTPVRTGNTTFTINSDVTAFYTTGRRIKMFDTLTYYGTIVSAVYSAPNTTVTVTMDSGTLSASLFAVAVGLIDPTNSPIPFTAISGYTDELSDGSFRIVGSSDATKKLAFEVDGLTTSTTRTLNIQDVDGTVYITGGQDVAVADGGTGLSSYTAGDILYASGTTTLSKLAKGTATQVLTMNSSATAPEWAEAYKSFTTSDLSIATSGSATVAHSLGGVPKIIRGFLKCTTAEYGFSVGDVVAYDSTNNRDSAGIMIITCGSDASNIIVRFGSSGNISVARKDTNADQAITLANWRYYVQAFI